MQMSVRFSFNETGGLIGPPRLTYATSGAPGRHADNLSERDQCSLGACLPLKFTDGLGGALAGRPIAIRYVDNRELGKESRASNDDRLNGALLRMPRK